MYLPAEVIFIFILTKYPTFQQKSTPFNKLRAGFFIQNKTRNLKNVLFHTPEEVEIYFNARSSPIWITILIFLHNIFLTNTKSVTPYRRYRIIIQFLNFNAEFSYEVFFFEVRPFCTNEMSINRQNR